LRKRTDLQRFLFILTSKITTTLKTFRMILSRKVVRSLIKIHKSVRYVPGFPHSWNRKTMSFVLSQCKYSWNLWLAFVSTFFAGSIYTLTKSLHRGDVVMSSIEFLSLTAIVMAMITIWFLFEMAETSVAFLNGLLHFDKYFGTKSKQNFNNFLNPNAIDFGRRHEITLIRKMVFLKLSI